MRALEGQGPVLDGDRRHDDQRLLAGVLADLRGQRLRRGRDACSITKLPQPANANNVSPIYGTDDRILFTSDRPRNGDRLTYPQLDEYESTPTVTGIWSMNPDGTRPELLDHAVSGDFTPLIAADGRVIFTRWDHLQRDQQNDEGTLRVRGLQLRLRDRARRRWRRNAEIFPELRARAVRAATIHGHTFNFFFPGRSTRTAAGWRR